MHVDRVSIEHFFRNEILWVCEGLSVILLSGFIND